MLNETYSKEDEEIGWKQNKGKYRKIRVYEKKIIKNEHVLV